MFEQWRSAIPQLAVEDHGCRLDSYCLLRQGPVDAVQIRVVFAQNCSSWCMYKYWVLRMVHTGCLFALTAVLAGAHTMHLNQT